MPSPDELFHAELSADPDCQRCQGTGKRVSPPDRLHPDTLVELCGCKAAVDPKSGETTCEPTDADFTELRERVLAARHMLPPLTPAQEQRILDLLATDSKNNRFIVGRESSEQDRQWAKRYAESDLHVEWHKAALSAIAQDAERYHALRIMFDAACAVLRTPDTTNDGGPGDLALDIRTTIDNYEVMVAEAALLGGVLERLDEIKAVVCPTEETS